ncbi:hypothetical protein FA13DRAFT_1779263 [Coprinellus micaceus]|uniref:Uncharacterized protein n=1 Tax=Coprinellus micaceus TaxID=71717 RepID=A0A4Y7SI16_COPMI|nr:hypothetical protein FA13DRAFT_1779263 [Coprinellus micaceus]
MHLYKSLISLSALLTLVCYAAPVERNAHVASRDIHGWVDELYERAGDDGTPPERYHPGSYKPVPNHHIFKTETNLYTAKEVNKAATNALTHARFGTTSDGKYPDRQGTGFKTGDPADPSGPLGPKDGKVALHDPIKNRKSDFSKSPANVGRPSGPDRVVVWRNPGEKKFAAHVSYHDTKKRVHGDKNHPPSSAKIYTGKVQIKHKMAEWHASKPPRAARHGPKSKPPSKTAQNKVRFEKHNAKQAQKFGNKRPQGPSKASQKKAQRKENFQKLNVARKAAKVEYKEGKKKQQTNKQSKSRGRK